MSASQPTHPLLQTVLGRDLRDPQELGEYLLGIRQSRKRSKDPLSQIYDNADWDWIGISDYNANPSCLEKYPPHPGAGQDPAEQY